jgi:hypothetical protein
MAVSTSGRVTSPADLDEINELVRGISNKKCWKASFSYGDELMLHIGARVAYSSKAMAGHEKGEWLLGTRGTDWSLTSGAEVIVTSDDLSDVSRGKVQLIENTEVNDFQIDYPTLALVIVLGGSYSLSILPDREQRSFDLPYWELFTPNHMLLKVGPNNSWTYTRSDLPESV